MERGTERRRTKASIRSDDSDSASSERVIIAMHACIFELTSFRRLWCLICRWALEQLFHLIKHKKEVRSSFSSTPQTIYHEGSLASFCFINYYRRACLGYGKEDFLFCDQVLSCSPTELVHGC